MAILLASCFFLFAIIGRVGLQVVQTGDHGIRLAERTAPLSEMLPGVVFVLAFCVSLVLIGLDALGHLEVATPAEWVMTLAAIIGFSGVLVVIVSQWQMGRSWRIGVDQNEETQLVMTGFYRRSRNPIYFGIGLYWIGLVMSFPHWAMLACAVICWLSIEMIVRKIEEPYLRRVHGQAFDEYIQQTKRFLIV